MRRLRLSPLLAASSALAVAASLLAAAPTSAQDSTDPEPVHIVDPDASITFTGSGWGHGVGMSQWGAYSRTLAGHSAADILGFYYEGAELVENYGRTAAAAPAPTPAPAPTTAPTSAGNPEGSIRVLLATADITALVPEGVNRITIDDADIAHNGQDATRVPPGTPITITRADNRWHIAYNGIQVCPTGCNGQTAQLHFATDTAVAVSNTARSYSHGRINLIAADQSPTRFHITLDHLTIQKYLTDPHNNPAHEQEQPEGLIRVLLATATATATGTTLVPEGVNRITIDDADIAHNGQDATRVPPGTPITITRADNRWHIAYNGIQVCPTGCNGQTAQLHFATDTAVAVSNTARSYSHGRINLIAADQSPTRFHITLDHLTIQKYLTDPHNAFPGAPEPQTGDSPEPELAPPPEPAHPTDAIRVLLATATGTTLTPEGLNRITIDGQGAIRVPPGTPVAITRHADHWHIAYGGADACGVGCVGTTAQLHFATDTSVAVSTTGRSYSHGRINLVPTGGATGEFHIVLDSLSIEKYLRGIAETPMNWPLTAHEAQAIAARSYAAATLQERRASASWTKPFDLYSTVWDQAFVGDTREKHADAGTWLQAVVNTAGRVLFHGGAPIRAFYSSSNGGHTEGSGYVFNADLPYLPAKPDPFDPQHNPHASWERVYAGSEFNQWLNDHPDTAVGRLQSMEITGGTGASGRVDEAAIRITGTSRTVTVTGSRLQSRINTAARVRGQGQLLSTKFTFSIPTDALVSDASQPTPADGSPRDDARFYSGSIDGPDFCLNRSLGGPTTYAHDSDGDGIADVCSLPRTRREAAARQQALEDMALLTSFRESLNAHFAEECLSVPETLGEPDKEPADECQQYRERSANAPADTGSPPRPISPAPTPPDGNGRSPDETGEDLFYSGVIDSPDFCFNHSLGGPTTYAHDSNGDGIADVCSLPRTRREAAARQQALERLALEYPSEFSLFFELACIEGPKTLGEPDKEASDECQPHIGVQAT
ncbi:MAG: SpoIID/LytB domain-containing protein [bacterium]|nr:SpoIID/LytB domain-containing protein [bacterium]MDE0118029.1 SpoIID/LytB domain-containing protein [bacterium]